MNANECKKRSLHCGINAKIFEQSIIFLSLVVSVKYLEKETNFLTKQVRIFTLKARVCNLPYRVVLLRTLDVKCHFERQTFDDE